MKPKYRRSPFASMIFFAAALANSQVTFAATIDKADNTDNLNLGSSWTGGVVPGAADVGQWSGLAGANSTLLGGNISLQGLAVGTTGGSVTIQNGNTLTLGSAGINLSAATQNLTISSNLTIGSGAQTWNVASGRTLTLNTASFIRSAGATLNLQGTGTVASNLTGLGNVNGIIGAWATVGSGTATRFGTLTSGNIVAYTGATSTTFSGTMGTATANFDQTGTGNSSARGIGLTANTVRNIAAAPATLVFNTTGSLTTNGLMNAGTGLLSIGSAANQGVGLVIGATNELGLTAASGGITVNSIVSGATGAAVTVVGPDTVTFGGNNTFSGNLNINGTLAAGTGQGAAPTASNLGALQPAANRNIIVNNGGILSLTGGNVLGTGGSTNTLSNTTLVVNSGGLFRTGLDGAGAGWWNKIGATNLNGGTIRVGSGANTGAFQALSLIGTVTVAGLTPSSIEAFAASNATSNGIHLGQNATANQSITFDVADVTASAAADLNVSTRLINTSSTLTASGLTKTGAGTMVLTATSGYTGATTISNGTLQLGNGTTDGSISTTSGITNNANLVFNVLNAHTYPGAVTGTGGLTKTGAGALTLSGANNYSGATTLNGGTLAIRGTVGTISVADATTNVIGNNAAGNLTASSLTFAGDATVSATLGASTPIVVTGALSTTPADGQVILSVPGAVANGLYDLISFGSFGGSISDFVFSGANLGPRQNGAPLLNGSNIAVNITGENIVWSGAGDGTWTTATTGDDTGSNNWARKTVQTATNFWASDTVEFNDTYNLGSGDVAVAQSSVVLSAAVSPVLTVFNNSSVNYELSGAAITTGSLVKNGTATVTLSNANTYPGTTTINGGKLILGNGTTNGTIAGTSSVINNAALEYNPAVAQTAAYAITGTGSLTKKGSTSLTLTGANTYSGGTTVEAGLLVANSTGLNAGPISINGGATLTFTGNGQVSSSTITGSGSILNNTANTVVFTGDHTGFTGSFNHNAALNNSQFNSALAGSQNATYSLTAGEMIFALSGDYTVKFGALSSTAGTIRGGNTATGTTTVEVGNLNVDSNIISTFNNGATKVLALTKVGTGTLNVIGGANYTGATSVNSGVLAFSTTPKTLGGSSFTVADGAALSVKAAAAGTTMLPTANLTLGTSELKVDFSNLTPTATQVSTGVLTLNGALTVSLANTTGLTLASGSYKLIDYTSFTGSGTLPTGTISVGNRATATIFDNLVDTSIDLVVSADKLLWTGLDSGTWSVGSTGASSNWKLNVAGTATDYLNDDQVVFDDTATGNRNIVIDSTNVSPFSTVFNTASTDYKVSGTAGIATGSLTKSGTGTVTLTNVNTYNGATTINAGTLLLGDGTTDGSIASTSSVTNNGTLSFNLIADRTTPYPILGTGNVTKTGAGVLTLSGANTYSGGSSINGGVLTLIGDGTLGSGTIALATGTTLNINKGLAFANTVTGSGAIVNTGGMANTGDFSGFSGTFTHNSPAVSVAFNSASSTSQNAAYTLASVQGSVQGFVAAGNGDYTLKIGSLSGVADSLFRGGLTAAGTTTLEIGNLNTNTTFAGSINNGTNKILALTKVGTGTLTLSGVNNYTGVTLVNAGTLNVTGSLTSISPVTVGSGAVLTGSGPIAGAVTSGGIIAPGVGAGTLSTGAASLSGTLAIEIDGTSGDKLLSSGAIELNSVALTVNLLVGGFSQPSYVIAEGTSITGTFSSVPTGYTVTIVSGGLGQQAVLSITSSYNTWATNNVGGNAANVDTDNDGIANGVEYFMNAAAGFTANPGIVSGAITWPNGGNIPASAYGTQFVVQTSGNLSTWTDVPVGSLTTNTNNTLTYTLPTGAGPFFVRLKVTPN